MREYISEIVVHYFNIKAMAHHKHQRPFHKLTKHAVAGQKHRYTDSTRTCSEFVVVSSKFISYLRDYYITNTFRGFNRIIMLHCVVYYVECFVV